MNMAAGEAIEHFEKGAECHAKVQAALDALEDKHRKRMERIIFKVEKRSHQMNTNMSGISLSRDDWGAIKEDARSAKEGVSDV